MVIKWSHFAKNNLQDFIKFSKLSSPKKYVNNLVDSIQLLIDNPRAGKIIFYTNNNETRQLIHKAHRIIYQIRNGPILIVAVLHTSHDLENSLKFIKKFF